MDDAKKTFQVLALLFLFTGSLALYMLRESHEWNPGLMAVWSGLFPLARTVSACVSAFLNIHADFIKRKMFQTTRALKIGRDFGCKQFREGL